MTVIKIIKDEKGVALLMVLLIATVTLAVTTTMLYMLVQSTRYSGLSKRYSSASEAGKAAAEMYSNFITYASTPAYRQELVDNLNFWPGADGPPAVLECEERKISTPFEEWKDACDYSLDMDVDDQSTVDATVDISDDYKAGLKIVHTFKGNTVVGVGTNDDTGWRNTCVIHCQGGGAGANAPAIFSSYIVEVVVKNKNNPDDKARYSVLLQY